MPSGEPGLRARDRQEIARALQYAGEASGLKYAVAVRGPDQVTNTAPVTDTAAWATAVHAGMDDPARSVLVAVDPTARSVRLVTGERSGRRLPDDRLAEIASSMAFLFGTRGLAAGVVGGLQQLGQLAGPPPPRRPRPTTIDQPLEQPLDHPAPVEPA